jgi:hypothetical protein
VPGTTHVATIGYGPQRVTDVGLLVSGTAVLGCLALLLLRAPPRAPAGVRRTPAPPVPAEPGAVGPSWVNGQWVAPDGGADWSRPPAPPTHGTAVPAGMPVPVSLPAAGTALEQVVADRPQPAWLPWARRVGAWAAAVAAAGVLGGTLLAVAAAVLAGWHLVRPPAPRTLLGGAAALLAAVPVAWLAFEPNRGQGLSAQVIAGNLWPHRLAAVALLLLAVGLARAERRNR